MSLWLINNHHTCHSATAKLEEKRKEHSHRAVCLGWKMICENYGFWTALGSFISQLLKMLLSLEDRCVLCLSPLNLMSIRAWHLWCLWTLRSWVLLWLDWRSELNHLNSLLNDLQTDTHFCFHSVTVIRS